VRIDQLRKAYDFEVKWIAFPLHPEIPEEGLALADLFKGVQVDINKVQARLKEAAADLGILLGERTRTYNTRHAQELSKWAEAQGAGEAFHRAVFKAYFVDGKKISAVDELIKIVDDLGLSGEAARKALSSGTYKDAVDVDWARVSQMGITAVPTFVMGPGKITGAQPYDVLEKFMRTNIEQSH
jgi:predicted DsbA family dithiol-disulfide isomerase